MWFKAFFGILTTAFIGTIMQISIEKLINYKDTPITQESIKNHTSSTPVIHQANSEKISPKYQNSSQNIDRFSETSDHKYKKYKVKNYIILINQENKYNWLNSLKECNNLDYFGYKWRLPSKNELSEISNYAESFIFSEEDINRRYWSYSELKENKDYSWRIYLKDGYGYFGEKNSEIDLMCIYKN
jgi:hypothetical protein